MKAVFIDRDGTIGGGDEVVLPNEFVPFDYFTAAKELLIHNGFKMIAFTNQPDISRGKCVQEDFEKELYNLGFDDVCICPHQSYENCICRKPKHFMITTMIEKYNLVKKECYVIGDRWSDMLAGINAGINVILVLTGAGKEAIDEFKDEWDINKASYITKDLLDAAEWIDQHVT